MITFTEREVIISETFEANAVVWVHSLPPGEQGPTRRVLEDMEFLTMNGGFPVFTFEVQNRVQFADVMTQVSTLVRDRGLRPILHVDAHGTEAEGLLLAPSGERVPWSEVIDLLCAVNVATNNNLVSIFALCFGLHLYKHVRLKEPVPAFLFAAPAKEISVGFLAEQTLEFYRQVNETSDVTAALRNTLGREMSVFHCQGLLFEALTNYVRQYTTSKQRKARVERMVTAILKRDRIEKPSSGQLKRIRKQIEPQLRAGQHIIDAFAPAFLIGRAAAFSYSDLERFLQRDRQ